MDLRMIQVAIDRAREAVAFEIVPDGFRAGSKTSNPDFRGSTISVDGEPWPIVRASLVSSHFQLIDATVRQRYEKGRPLAIAVLDPPAKPGKRKLPEPKAEYLKKFQSIAWRAFGVVWVLGDGNHKWKFLPSSDCDFSRGDIGELAEHVRQELESELKGWTPSSREAERRIREVLAPRAKELGLGERAKKRSYDGLWRRPIADEIWLRDGRVPARVGMEVKVQEDVSCPLCQPLELLAEVDGVIRIRWLREKAATKNEWTDRAIQEFAEAAPVRYIDIIVK